MRILGQFHPRLTIFQVIDIIGHFRDRLMTDPWSSINSVLASAAPTNRGIFKNKPRPKGYVHDDLL